MISVKDLLETKSKVWELGISTDFERKFLLSITREKDIYNESTFFPRMLNMSDMKLYRHLSKKQEEIYYNIEMKYNCKSIKGDLFEKYIKLFKEKNIILDSFDLRHLEKFKGVLKESENFKKWLIQIDSSFQNEL